MFKPLHDNVIVRVMPHKTTTPGGLHIPETVESPSPRGEVVAVGDGFVRDDGSLRKPVVAIGDVVVYMRSAAVPLSDSTAAEQLVVLGPGHLLAKAEAAC